MSLAVSFSCMIVVACLPSAVCFSLVTQGPALWQFTEAYSHAWLCFFLYFFVVFYVSGLGGQFYSIGWSTIMPQVMQDVKEEDKCTCAR